MLELVKTTQFKKLNFTHQAVRQLFSEILGKKAYFAQHPQIFDTIRICLMAIIDHLELERNIEEKKQGHKKSAGNKPLHLRPYEKRFYSGQATEYALISLVGGRYYPFLEILDPLSEEGGVSCFGYVYSWAQEIATNGYYSLGSHCDKATLKYQLNQIVYIPRPFFSCNYQQNTAWKAVKDILDRIKSDSSYLIILPSNKECPHTFGIRKIPGSTEIEVFDPVLGTCVFPHESFTAWFTQILSAYYLNWQHSKVCLAKLSSQPLGLARASIPVLKPCEVKTIPKSRIIRPKEGDKSSNLDLGIQDIALFYQQFPDKASSKIIQTKEVAGYIEKTTK